MTKLTSVFLTLISLFLLSTVIAAACPGSLFKFPLDTYPNARCLDGTPGAFYMQLVEGSKKWMISLEGGGECVNAKECYERSKTVLGSSSTYADSMDMFQLQSCDSTNPFKDWNKIYLKYCSGDLFMGQDVRPSSRVPDLQFSGYQIMRSTIDYLYDNHQISRADDVILTGLSAGGLGVVGIGDEIIDWLYLKIAPAWTPTQTTRRVVNGVEYRGPKVAIVPIAGYHFETSPVYIQKRPEDPKPVGFIPWQFEPDWKNYYTFWNSTVSRRCVQQGKWRNYECMIAQGNYETSVTPWFVIQSTLDSVVLPLHGGCPTVWYPDVSGVKRCNTDDAECPGSVKDYMRIWHGNMSQHIAPVEQKHLISALINADLHPKDDNGRDGDDIELKLSSLRFGWNQGIKMDGAFASACLLHTEFALTSPIINNLNYRNALWAWYRDENSYEFGQPNPHFHMDWCPPGSVLCGQCKKT